MSDCKNSSTPVISVVLPCLNEARTVRSCVRDAFAGIEQAELPGEVIVADNNSIDDSSILAAKAGARVVTVLSRGYGAALRGGLNESRGKFLIMADSDGTYEFSQIGAIVKLLSQGYDMAVGNRF